jgi:hypothetical protein
MPATVETATTACGTIHADACYSLIDLRTKLGIGQWALRKMRRNGLIVRRYGRRSFVLGRDLIAEIERHGKVVE